MKRASAPLLAQLLPAAVVLAAGAASCAAEPETPASPCVAFAKASAPRLRAEPASTSTRTAVVRVRAGAGHTYALDAAGNLGTIDGAAGSAIAVGGAGDVDFAVKPDGSAVQAFVARWVPGPAGGPTTFELARYTSADAGLTFDATSKKVLLTVPGGRPAGEAAALAFDRDGLLFVAIGDAEPPESGAPKTLLGSILRIDVSAGASTIPADAPAWVSGVHQPRGLDVDPMTGDLWVTDYSVATSTTVVHRFVRGGLVDPKPILSFAAPDRRPAFTGGHVYRGKLVPALAGRYVYTAGNGSLVAVDRYGSSGPAEATKLALGADGPIARGQDDELVVAPATGGLARVTDASEPAPTPTSLLATRCWDPGTPGGAPTGAVTYDVTSPLWSDGATKERFVVVPKGTKLTARADGDLVFPVGTVAVKTFAVDGKRIETRLLVQHDVEDWVGYSYAWNEAGTDAELVQGNRVAPLAGGKSWYFPSRADCNACHTPAAGYTLGLEAKQLAGDALGRLESSLEAPLDHATLVPLVSPDAPPPATLEARARSYLHANCSMCHREGSVTGLAVDLDLRIDTPLAKTGLCSEPKAGSFDLTNARIIAPHDPSRSILLSRMRSLDERRMPKLASRVVDEAGAAAVEAWIKELSSCP